MGWKEMGLEKIGWKEMWLGKNNKSGQGYIFSPDMVVFPKYPLGKLCRNCQDFLGKKLDF